MEKAGHKHKYEKQIATEVSVRLAQLKKLDAEIQEEARLSSSSATA
jgi:hypothetical protein